MIHSVQSEPAAAANEEAVKPTKRHRRIDAEMQVVKAELPISVNVDGLQLDGQADYIARLVNAIKPTA